MTPTEALTILEQATAAMMGTRADHEKVAEALRTIQTAITPVDPLDPDPDGG